MINLLTGTLSQAARGCDNEIEGIDAARAKETDYVPVVLTVAETREMIAAVPEAWRLKVGLPYGCGMRIGECLNIRIKDVDLSGATLTAYGKGGKSRILSLPKRLLPALEREVSNARKTTEKYVKMARAMRGEVCSPLDKLWDSEE